MSFDSLLTHRLKVRRMTITGRDRYNDERRELTEEVETRGRVDVVAADENLQDREETTTRFVVFLPAGTAIDAADELEWVDRSDTYGAFILKVDGEPMPTYDASTEHHLELFAYRTRG